MLMRFDPFREFDRMATHLMGDDRVPRAMPMDAYRRGDEFVVAFDLPGVDPDSVDLTVERNVLTVTARRAAEHDEQTEVLVAERPQGTFSRQVFLGESLDADRLEASYDAGVLHVRVPVLESAKPRRIPVAVGTGGKPAIETTAERS